MFETKTWKDRITEYPTRRTLTKEDGTTEIVTVARNEGTISEGGDAFSAENMNDLEQRVESAFSTHNLKTYTSLSQLGLSYPVKIQEIYVAMQSDSMLILKAEKSAQVTDLPDYPDYTATYGVLEIVKTFNRGRVHFTQAVASRAMNPNLFVGQINGTTGEDLVWKRVSAYIELTGTLVAGETTITLTDDAITTNSKFDFLTSIYSVSPVSAPVVTDGSITLEFDVQETDMTVEVRVS